MKFFGAFSLALLLISSQSLAQGRGPSGPVPVRVAAVKEELVSSPVEALGTARAWEFVSLRSNATERVTRIAFESGQLVAEGDVLVELRHAEEKAELAGARASLERYQRDVDRLKGLVSRKLSTREQLDAAETQVAETKSRVDVLQARVDDRIIRAPFGGQLGLRNISVGSLVQPSTEIVTLQDLSRIKVDFTVPERQLARLKAGMKVTARSQAHSGREFQGEVMLVEPRIDPETRALTVRARINNPEQLLKPGMLLEVEVQSQPRNALTIPEAAIVPRADRSWVYVVERGDKGLVARQREVTLGQRYPGKVEVLSGLNGGEQVVTRGTIRLRDGQSVELEGERAAQ